MEIPEINPPRVRFTRPFLIFYIAVAYLTSVSLSYTLEFLLWDSESPIFQLLIINSFTGAGLFFWNLPFRFPLMSEIFPHLAPLLYILYWQIYIQNYENYHDPLPALLLLFLTALWSLRKLFFWQRSWKTLRDLAEDSVFKAKGNFDFSMNTLMHFIVLPAIIFFIFIPFQAIFTRETALNFTDIVGLLICLTAIFWDSAAEQHRFLLRSQHKFEVRYPTSGLWRLVRYPEHVGFLIFCLGLIFLTDSFEMYSYYSLIGIFCYYAYLRFWFVPRKDAHWISIRPEYISYKKRKPPLIPIKFMNL